MEDAPRPLYRLPLGGELSAYAAKKAWAKCDRSAKTLTFYYGEKGSLGADEYDLNKDWKTPEWYNKNCERFVTKVVFDKSFAQARPTTCYEWFWKFGELTSVEGIENFNTSNVTNMSNMFYGCTVLSSLDVSNFNTSNVTNMSSMFSSCKSLTTLNLSNFNTSNVTNMRYMFFSCKSLITLDLSSFDTRKVTDISYMFNGCSNLTTIYASDKFVLSSVTTVEGGKEVFSGDRNLKGAIAYDPSTYDKTYATINGGYFLDKKYTRPWVKYANGTLSFQYGYKKTLGNDEYPLNEEDNSPSWNEKRDVTKVVFDKSFAQVRPTSCYKWFYNFGKLTTIEGIENLNTSNVTNMGYMFYGCSVLTSLDVSNFNTSNVTNMSSIFNSCKKLTFLDVSHFDTQNVVWMSYMFSFCSGLTSLDISHFDTKNVVVIDGIFAGCCGLTSLDVSHLNTQNMASMAQMFYLCSGLTTLDLSNFDTQKVSDMSDMFNGCSNLTTIYASDKFVLDRLTSDKDSENMFSGCTNLKGDINFDVTKVDKTYATIDGGYFIDKNLPDCPWVKYNDGTLTFLYGYKKKLQEGEYWLNADDFANPDWLIRNTDVTKVVFDKTFAQARPITCYSWFNGFSKLSTIEGIENLNTSNVTGMAYMFLNCSGLTSLDVSHFDTQKVKYMFGMFYGCKKITSLDVTQFDTQNVTDMSYMFVDCSKLATLVLSSFSTQKVTDMAQIFSGCSGLTSLDLSNFDTQNVTSVSKMFYNCSNLTTIYVSDKFVVSSVTDSKGKDMFSGCKKLKGDIEYNPSKVDKTYATVDGGYFRNIKYLRPWVKFVDGVLTFQYGYKETVGNDEYLLVGGTSMPGWRYKDVTKVVFDKTFEQARPTSCYEWFRNFEKLSTIEGIENFNTSKVRIMYRMFDGCSALTSLDVSNFNTSEVTDMSSMFFGCSRLTSLDVSHFNTSNVTSMYCMFDGCSALTSLDLSSFDILNLKNVGYMFAKTPNLSAIYFGNKFDAGKLSSISNTDMFSNCPATLYCSPLQYESFKSNSIIASYGQAVKPYVSINKTPEYGTLCVPVGSSLVAGSFTGFDKLYQVTNADKNKGSITLTEAKSIEPGVPYVYHRYLEGVDFDGKNDMSVITFEVDADASSSVTAPKNEGHLLKGTFESMVAKGGSYILQTDGNFHPVAADNTTLKVGAYRAYLDLSSTEIGGGDEGFGEAKAYSMVFEGGEATGIDRINGDSSNKGIYDQADLQPKVYFDLMGRKVAAPQKGEIYIVNGKKVVYNK